MYIRCLKGIFISLFHIEKKKSKMFAVPPTSVGSSGWCLFSSFYGHLFSISIFKKVILRYILKLHSLPLTLKKVVGFFVNTFFAHTKIGEMVG